MIYLTVNSPRLNRYFSLRGPRRGTGSDRPAPAAPPPRRIRAAALRPGAPRPPALFGQCILYASAVKAWNVPAPGTYSE
jgi:hypothetical protein